MAPPTSKRGGKYATTYDYSAANVGIKRPYIPAENRIVKALIEASLESGLSYSDSVRLGIGVYKELDVLARDEKGNIFSRTALKDIRVYCRAIMRSGTTFSSFEIATRAVAAYRLTLTELAKLHAEWDRETVSQRLKLRETRKKAAAKSMGNTADDIKIGLIDDLHIPGAHENGPPSVLREIEQDEYKTNRPPWGGINGEPGQPG